MSLLAYSSIDLSRISCAVLLLVLSGCGRVGFDPASIIGDDRTRDGGVLPGQEDGSVTGSLDAGDTSQINLAPTWSYEILLDFSDDFTYTETDFMDGLFPLDNTPTDFITIGPPFHDGVVILVGRELLDYDHDSGNVVHRDYTPTVANDIGPDFPIDLAFAPPGMDGISEPGIWLTSGSFGAGDGLFRIDLNWGITRQSTPGNVSFVDPDIAGVVPGRNAKVTYLGVVSSNLAQAGIESLGGPRLINENIEDGKILSDGRMIVITGDFDVSPRTTQIGILDNGSVTPMDAVVPETQRIVQGDVSVYGALGMVVQAPGVLRSMDSSGTWSEIAREPTTNWQWSSAQAVPAGVLSVDSQSILVLRTQLATSQLQLLRFWQE